MQENRVQLEIFEGPLDLLLYLVKKEEVDIYQVNLTKIATQFIEYIEVMRSLDLDIAGEFIVMASTLMYIKSKELLPVEKRAEVQDEEDGDDPRWELIRKLVEYKKYKDAAASLQSREGWQENIYGRKPDRPAFLEENRLAKPEVSVFDLVNAVSAILKRFQQKDTSRDVFEDKWTVSEKIELMRGLIATRKTMRFSELFQDVTSRVEVVVTFLALLELIRLKQLRITQSEPFAEIDITEAPPEQPAAPGQPVETLAEGSSPTPPEDLPQAN